MIEANFDEPYVAALAAAEKQVQQSYRPVIAVHKWFARRPGTLFRALALAELVAAPLADHYLEGHELEGVVLDPFMGGGTTIFEANRIGLSTIGYDTNPMSRWLVERELEPLDVEAFERVGEGIATDLEAELGHLYVTNCVECGSTVPVKFFLWVKTHVCPCGRRIHLFPGPLVASSRMGRHTHEVLVCGNCLSVEQYTPGEEPSACPNCGSPYEATRVASKGSCRCGRPFAVGRRAGSGPPQHTLFALEYHCEACKRKGAHRGRFFKAADRQDHARYAAAVALRGQAASRFWPQDPIREGDETRRLLRWGYRSFHELHNDRQLVGLAALAERIAAAPAQVRPALATVFSDFLRYQNMLCRYDTAALKVLDVFSVHGFPVHRVQCEAALIGIPRVGSGGFRHFLAKYAAAKRYCRRPYETVRIGGRKRRVEARAERISATFVDDPKGLRGSRKALLRCASICESPLPAESVDMVLTDPPYFANVQYSELMDFCYAWLRRLVPETPYFAKPTTRSDAEVVGNATKGRGVEAFARRLADVFQAAARALRPGGPFIFTYHHNDLSTYASLVVAALDAELVPITTFVCPTEMRGSVHIYGANASRLDTVFVLRKPPARVCAGVAGIEERLRTHIENLRSVGLTVTAGDRRCIRHGLIAEEVMRALAPTWPPEGGFEARLAHAQRLLLDRAGLADRVTADQAGAGWERIAV